MGSSRREIGWHPWGKEAFDLAGRLHRPILLDVGATWCHWCHVMDETTYTDEEVVNTVEEFFVPVKVDRDRNPEVDRRYQHLVGLATGEGGWPLTALLTPAGELITGGTYFPPRDAGGRPGMRRLLRSVLEQWKAGIPETLPRQVSPAEKLEMSALSKEARTSFVESVMESLKRNYDDLDGGFGMAPKFPHPMALRLAMARNFLGPDEGLLSMATETLRKMSQGGTYDQLGGGFHRYSVDRGWHIPHFEKLSLDNAFLLKNYVEAYAVTKDIQFLGVIRGIVDYVKGTLCVQGGGFASSQDADHAPGDDGQYFTWDVAELKHILSREEFRVAQRRFGIATEGRMPHDPDQNVLFILFSTGKIAKSLSIPEDEVESLLASAVSKMSRTRGKRSPPKVDPTLYSSVNGYLAGAMAQASTVLRDPQPLEAAEKALALFITPQMSTRGIPHEMSGNGDAVGWGHLEDQASFVCGLLDVAEVSGNDKYVSLAGELLELVWERFRDPSGLLVDVSEELYDGHMPPGATEKRFPLEDSPHLSPNASIALSLLRYSALTGDESHGRRAEGLADAIVPRVIDTGLFGAGTALAESLLDVPVTTVTIVGTGDGAEKLYFAAATTYDPRKIILREGMKGRFQVPREAMEGLTTEGKSPVALVCVGNVCLPPTDDPNEIPGKMSSARARQ